jgi:hypothetical protein
MDRKTAYNGTFAIGGVSCLAESFVVKEELYLQMNFCARKPAYRKSAKRQTVKKLNKVNEIFRYLPDEKSYRRFSEMFD